MKARLVTLAALAAAVTLTAVAAAGPGAAKQRVAIDMKLWPQKTFVLTPLQPMQAGPLKRDTGTISHTLLSISGHGVMRDGQQVTIYNGGVITLTGKLRNPHDSKPERVGRSRAGREWRRSERRHRRRHLEGRPRDRPVRRDRREGARCPHRPR